MVPTPLLSKFWWNSLQVILRVSLLSTGNDSDVRDVKRTVRRNFSLEKRKEDVVWKLYENCVLHGCLKQSLSHTCSTRSYKMP